MFIAGHQRRGGQASLRDRCETKAALASAMRASERTASAYAYRPSPSGLFTPKTTVTTVTDTELASAIADLSRLARILRQRTEPRGRPRSHLRPLARLRSLVDHSALRRRRQVGAQHLVRATERATWCVDGKSVEVRPSLIASFSDESAASYFVSEGRATLVQMTVGGLACFVDEEDTRYHVRAGLGTMLTRRQVGELAAKTTTKSDASPRRRARSR
jgi:hypothetical protein